MRPVNNPDPVDSASEMENWKERCVMPKFVIAWQVISFINNISQNDFNFRSR